MDILPFNDYTRLTFRISVQLFRYIFTSSSSLYFSNTEVAACATCAIKGPIGQFSFSRRSRLRIICIVREGGGGRPGEEDMVDRNRRCEKLMIRVLGQV